MIIAEVCGRLAKGEPLAQICRDPGMPWPDQVLKWAQEEPDSLGLAIARARTNGFDAIALDALKIIDGQLPIEGQTPDAARDKARAEVRLKLLAKWDPKRYGDAFQLRHADADGEKLDTAPLINEMVGLVRGVRARLEGAAGGAQDALEGPSDDEG